jgi:hypothetical protein
VKFLPAGCGRKKYIGGSLPNGGERKKYSNFFLSLAGAEYNVHFQFCNFLQQRKVRFENEKYERRGGERENARNKNFVYFRVFRVLYFIF